MKRHTIPGSDAESVSFKHNEGIVINCTENILGIMSILISQAIISHFCLVDCNDGHQVELYVPLSLTASVVLTIQTKGRLGKSTSTILYFLISEQYLSVQFCVSLYGTVPLTLAQPWLPV